MQLNRDILNGAMPEQEDIFSQAFDKALRSIEQNESNPSALRFPRRRIAGIVLAATLALVTALGVAEGVRRTIFAMMEKSTLPEQATVQPQAESLVKTGLGTLATENLDVEVLEALYDGGTIRLAYTITQRGADDLLTQSDFTNSQSAFMQALSQDKVSLTGPDWFELDGEKVGMTGGSQPVYVPGNQPGEAVVYLDIKLSSAGIKPEGTFTVGLPIVSGKDVKGKSISFALDADNLPGVVNLTPSTTSSLDGVTVTVKDLRLSPIKVYLTYRVDVHDDVPEADLLETMACWNNAKLVNEDGQALLPIGAHVSYGLPEGETDTLRHMEQTLEFVPIAEYPDVLYLAPDTPMAQSYTPDMTQTISFSVKEGESK